MPAAWVAAQAPPTGAATPPAASPPAADTAPADGTAPQATPAAGEERKFTDKVVVTATRSERTAEELPLSATVVSRDEIDLAAHAELDGILRSIAGVNVPNGSSETQYPSRNSISLRGLGEGRALVLLDGVPLNDPMFGNIDWNRISVGGVERIEVVRGGSAALYGSGAMGGTISILSRPLVDGALSADVSYGSQDTRRGAVSYAKRVAGGVTVGLDLGAGDSDGYNRIPEELRRPVDIDSDWRDRDARLRAEIDVAPGVTAFARTEYSSYDLGLGTPVSRTENESTSVAAGMRFADLGGGQLAWSAFYQDSQFDVANARIAADGGSATVSNLNYGPSRMFGGSLQWTVGTAGDRAQLTLGTDLRRMSSSSFRENYSAAGALTSTQDSGGRQESAGAFGQVSWTPRAGLEVLASLRADYWRNSDGYNVTSSGTGASYASDSTTELSPRLAARWELGGGLGLRAAAYRAFGAPQLRQLYRYSSFRDQENLPNPELGPETVVGGDVGLDLAVPRLRGQLNLFENRVRDIVSDVILYTVPLLGLQPQNVGTARSRGVELMGEAYLGDRWSLALNLAHTDTSTLESPQNPALEGKQIPFVPRNAASLGAVYRGPRGAVVSTRVSYVDEMFIDAENLFPFDSHTLVDLFASLPLSDVLEAYLGVTNAFGEEYLDDIAPTARYGPPRQVRVGVRLRTVLGGQPAGGTVR